MDEKKIFEMSDDALKGVTGGQGEMSSDTLADYTFPEDMYNIPVPELLVVPCPECGGPLKVHGSGMKGQNVQKIMVCPHCNKPISVSL